MCDRNTKFWSYVGHKNDLISNKNSSKIWLCGNFSSSGVVARFNVEPALETTRRAVWRNRTLCCKRCCTLEQIHYRVHDCAAKRIFRKIEVRLIQNYYSNRSCKTPSFSLKLCTVLQSKALILNNQFILDFEKVLIFNFVTYLTPVG